ncbi:hypothetical protein GCM10009559_39180 [Pseudonocardia zijingensis]|uniref:Uncharacterized protein n=1 Tax=Pseudonocardia zijingensis TaxID=153376 RepID=A0ABN1QHK1_9PSEU
MESTNLAVIVLRRRPDEGERDHVRILIVLPWLGLASGVALAAQKEATVWLRAGLLLALGLVLFGLTRLGGRLTRAKAWDDACPVPGPARRRARPGRPPPRGC